MAGQELAQAEKDGEARRLGPILGPISAKEDWIEANKHLFSCYLRVAGVISSTRTAEQSE